MASSRARLLRRSQTEAEKMFWRHVRNRQLDGWKFCRQMPIDRFIADFVCREQMLIIEIDGGHHADNQSDVARAQKLKELGYRVLRYWNHDVLTNIDGVLEALRLALNCPSPRPSPQRGEGVEENVEEQTTTC